MNYKLPYGNTSDNEKLVLPEGVMTFNTERKALHIHDGVTLGGLDTPVRPTRELFTNGWNVIADLATAPTTRGVLHDPHVTGKWLIVGDDGFIQSSTDGIDWTTVYTGIPAPRYLSGIAVSDTRVVVIGSAGFMMTTTDGLSWARLPPPSGTTLNLQRCTYANGKWLLTAGSSGSVQMWVSTDGVNWVPLDMGIGNIQSFNIYYLNGLWAVTLANGRIATSPDAVNWVLRQTPLTASLRAFARIKGLWVVAGNLGEIATSPDLTTWTHRSSGTSDNINIVLTTPDLLIAGGYPNARIHTSPDGVNWTERHVGSGLVMDMAVGGDQLVAAMQSSPPLFTQT